MVAAALVASVAVVCASALTAWRWWLTDRAASASAGRDHDVRLAQLRAQEVSEGLRQLPTNVESLERRVKQLELLSRR